MSFNPHQWYLNGFKKVDTINTIIKGVASTINTPSLVASKMSPTIVGSWNSSINSSEIKNFIIVGDDVHFRIDIGYRIKGNAWQNNLLITDYQDLEGKVQMIGNVAFYGCSNLAGDMYFENLTTMDGYYNFQSTKIKSFTAPKLTILPELVFYQCYLLESVNTPLVTNMVRVCFYRCLILNYINISSVLKIGASHSVDNANFYLIKLGCTIIAPIAMQTINGGNVEADLQYAITSRSAVVTYV